MSVTIQIRRGTKANLPTLAVGEWGLVTDQEEVYIGGNFGNIQVPTQADIANLQQQINAGTITSQVVTASASAWGTNPISQTITVPGLGADALCWVGLDDSATFTQRDAARKAVISPTAQAENSITLTCDGVAPSVNLPILVYISGGAA